MEKKNACHGGLEVLSEETFLFCSNTFYFVDAFFFLQIIKILRLCINRSENIQITLARLCRCQNLRQHAKLRPWPFPEVFSSTFVVFTQPHIKEHPACT